MKLSKRVSAALSVVVLLVFSGMSFSASAVVGVAQAGIAATQPEFLRLEITSACTDKGAVFKIINRGGKWPRTGYLRLYHADSKSMIGERRLRLAAGQKVSFVVKKKISKGRPVGIWVEPEWYKREFEFDARTNCG